MDNEKSENLFFFEENLSNFESLKINDMDEDSEIESEIIKSNELYFLESDEEKLENLHLNVSNDEKDNQTYFYYFYTLENPNSNENIPKKFNQNIQKKLEIEFQKSNPIFKLKFDGTKNTINLRDMEQTKIGKKDKIKIKLKIFRNELKKEDISKMITEDDKITLFYFNSNEKEMVYNKLNTTYSQYNENDQVVLREAYAIYRLNNYYDKVDLKCGYRIDFSKMIQINIKDNQKQRSIKRSLPDMNIDIIHPQRYSSDIEENDDSYKFEYMQKIIEKKLSLMIDNHVYSLGTKKIHFNIISGIDLKLEIKFDLCFFYGRQKKDFNEFIKLLKKEISDLADSFDERGTLENYFDFIDKLTNDKSFFFDVIKMYTFDGFLFKTINKILNEKNSWKYDKIKFYYTSLIASLEYICREEGIPNYYKKLNTDIYIYRVTKIDNSRHEEILLNLKNQSRDPIVFNEFLSCSADKDAAVNIFMKLEKDIFEYLWEIKITHENIDKLSKVCAFIKQYSQYKKEEEVLIKSGSMIMIENLIPLEYEGVYYQNKFKISCTILPFNFSEYVIKNLPKTDEKILTLPFNSIGRNIDYIRYLVKGLEFYSNIIELNISCNGIGGMYPKEMIVLSKFLGNNNVLQKLNLMGNLLGKNPENIYNLCIGLICNKSIIELVLSYNCLGENSKNMEIFSEYLKNSEYLKDLDISFNNLGYPENMKFLDEGLRNHKSLEILSIYCNNIGKNVEEIRHLSNMLENNKSIKKLSFRENLLGENVDNMILFVNALTNNKTLKRLYIPYNKIGKSDINMDILSEGLKNNEGITHIDLSYNLLGDNINNIEKVAEFLMNNKSIEGIDIRVNRFPFNIKEQIENLIGEKINIIEILF